MGNMKNKLICIILSFISGASLSQIGNIKHIGLGNQHYAVIDAQPTAHVQKLTPAQLKEVLNLNLSGFDAYVITVKNSSRRSYSISTSSLDMPIISYDKSQKILAKKTSHAFGIATSIAGQFFWPISVIGGVYKLSVLKTGKVFEGKLKAMLLDQAVIESYSQLSRIVLVESSQNLHKASIELIDMHTSQAKTITIS